MIILTYRMEAEETHEFTPHGSIHFIEMIRLLGNHFDPIIHYAKKYWPNTHP